ncbi:MAG: zinc-binding dehydrogenase [Dehalococcoidia bacterium]|nr:zinc-binding dehydrogenase [Dehalococcoidia bacterium]MDW8120419.1 zinc-binding dehydrogenase [Chloroflexota bacterium]
MKAVYIQQHGGPEVLTYGEVPDPVPGWGEVKVRVRACSLNRLDVWIRTGLRGTRREFPQPFILGLDIAGDVVEVGPGVRTLRGGERVVLDPVLSCGQCDFCRAGQDDLCPSRGMLGSTVNGGYAEYVVAPAANAYLIPPNLSYEEAAAMPTTFMPVWHMLVRKGAVKPWETVLVLSASAGVGTAAIQVAKRVLGARVIATTSTPDKAQRARSLGADEVIIYTQEDLEKRVLEVTGGRGVDMVVDHVGAEFWPKAYAVLARGGRYGVCGVTTGYRTELHMGQLFSKQVMVFGVSMGNKEDFRQVVDAARRGLVKGLVDKVFPLAEARRAHETMESRSFFGKLVLQVG